MSASVAPLSGLHPRQRGLKRKLAWIFALQCAAMALVLLMGHYGAAPVSVMLLLTAAICALTWLVAQRQWRPVSRLAGLISHWNNRVDRPGLATFPSGPMSRYADADVVTLTDGMRSLIGRLHGYNERERNFTRDASHELRSPLTVIKMSTDMLADEQDISEFGRRSVQRIRRATHEMEALVEALLVLARELDNGQGECDFVVNDVLRNELAEMEEILGGHVLRLRLQEHARLILHGSPRVFVVLCQQLIRQAGQYVGQGHIQINILAERSLSVSVHPGERVGDGLLHQEGFEYAIAQRISERFGWPLELSVNDGCYLARIRFPKARVDETPDLPSHPPLAV
jgi:two-component system, OmpR family, sensor histidine kinase QseC